MSVTKKTKLEIKKDSKINLITNINGNAVEIQFVYLGFKFEQDGTTFYKFESLTKTPFKQNLSEKAILKMLPAPATASSFSLTVPKNQADNITV